MPDNMEEDGNVSQALSDDIAFASRDSIDFDTLKEGADDDLADDLGDKEDNNEDDKGEEDDEGLMESTATVQVALNKVCCINFFYFDDLRTTYRSVDYHSLFLIQPPKPSLHGARHAVSISFPSD